MLVDDPVKRVDNMTMAHGLEARTPFLDHDLVELAAACPPELKLAHGGKGVLKDAARGVVPDAVIDRPKGYFPVPALSHLEGPVRRARARGAARARRRATAGCSTRRGSRAARRAQRPPHDPRGQQPVAARPAGAVASAAGRLTGGRAAPGCGALRPSVIVDDVLAAEGPGPISADRALGLERAGVPVAAGCLALAGAGSAGVYLVSRAGLADRRP